MDGPSFMTEASSLPIDRRAELTGQDAYDIITGAYIAKRGGIPPLTDTRPLVMRAVYLLSLPVAPTRPA